MTNIRPLPGYVLVEPIKEEEKTAGGLYLTERSQDKPMKGIVVAKGIYMNTGNELYNSVLWDSIKEGATVIFKKWTNQEVTHEGKEYLLISFSELLAIIE